MRNIITTLLLGTALVTPSMVWAKDVTVSVDMVRFSGNPAYLAVYLTKPDGSYDSTLWVSGSRQRYLGHLRQWATGVRAVGVNIDGITGASVGGGQTLTVKSNVADALIDAGYKVNVDTAVENGGEYSSDAVAPLTIAGSGKPVDGTGYVSKLTVSM